MKSLVRSYNFMTVYFKLGKELRMCSLTKFKETDAVALNYWLPISNG